MRKISTWAKFHPYQARTYIVIIKVILGGMAITTGKAIAEAGISLSPLPAIISAGLLFLAILIYPQKRSGSSRKETYVLRKSLDFTLGFTTFVLITALAANNKSIINDIRIPAANAASAIKIHPPTAEEILASLKYRDKSSLTKQEKRILKKELGKQVKVYARAKLSGDKNGETALLIILTIIGAIGLTWLVAALACSVACGGAEGLAIVITVLGLAGIIFGTIVLIKKIVRRHNKKPEQEPAAPATQ